MLETEMRVLGKKADKNLPDRVPNEEVRNICKREEINDWIKVRKTEWNNHSSRISEEEVVRVFRDKSGGEKEEMV